MTIFGRYVGRFDNCAIRKRATQSAAGTFELAEPIIEVWPVWHVGFGAAAYPQDQREAKQEGE